MTKLTVDEKDAPSNGAKGKSDLVRFLVHDQRDTVGVAVDDIQKGEKITGVILDGQSRIAIVATMDIPLGHKVGLKDFKPGDVVIKYGESIGVVVAEIHKGDHVHVHNLKTARW